MPEIDQRRIIIDFPFDTSTIEAVIGQGFKSDINHNKSGGHDLVYSLDFVLPTGTPVTAVQDGTVELVRRSIDCYRDLDPIAGRRAWSTQIDVRHPQFEKGTGKILSMFQHLDPNTISVVEGQKVTRGQILAYTGLTGWVGPIPHLHLSMLESQWPRRQTIPFKFKNCDISLYDRDIACALTWQMYYGSELASSILEVRERAEKFIATLEKK